MQHGAKYPITARQSCHISDKTQQDANLHLPLTGRQVLRLAHQKSNIEILAEKFSQLRQWIVATSFDGITDADVYDSPAYRLSVNLHNHNRMYQPGQTVSLNERFRGYLPVVVDVETGGFNERTDALLEVAAVLLDLDEHGRLRTTSSYSTHVIPFDGANLDQKSLEVNGIDPFHPLRAARAEHEALAHIFTPIRKAVSDAGCTRAILVGHNAFFDLKFVNAAADRCRIKRNPFHPFSCFDTVSLCGLAYGQTVLARGAAAAGMPWDTAEAHSAIYDTRMTAELFCKVVNRWEELNAAYNATP